MLPRGSPGPMSVDLDSDFPKLSQQCGQPNSPLEPPFFQLPSHSYHSLVIFVSARSCNFLSSWKMSFVCSLLVLQGAVKMFAGVNYKCHIFLQFNIWQTHSTHPSWGAPLGTDVTMSALVLNTSPSAIPALNTQTQ